MGYSKSSVKRKVYSSVSIHKKGRKSPYKNLTPHFKILGNEQQKEHKSGRKKEIKGREDIKDLKTPKQKISETKSWFIEKINKFDNLLAILTKKERKRILINRIRNDRGDIITETTEIQRIMRNLRINLEMNKFLESYNLSRLNLEDLKYLNRPITIGELERIVNSHAKIKKPRPKWIDQWILGLKKPCSQTSSDVSTKLKKQKHYPTVFMRQTSPL